MPNMIRFEAGSVLNGAGRMEHMASFNYAYKLAAVRDWLFEQAKCATEMAMMKLSFG